MTHTKNARPAAQNNCGKPDLTCRSIPSPPQNHAQESFFRFVDQNPLFRDNTKDAIRALILSLHEKNHIFKTQISEADEYCGQYFHPLSRPVRR